MTSPLGSLDTDSFEIKRVMRQEAHEKAFEIKLLQTQNLFEKEKEKIFKEGKDKIDEDYESKMRNVQMDLNIKRSAAINSTRMDLMNIRNDFMVNLVKETLERLANEVSKPDNPKY